MSTTKTICDGWDCIPELTEIVNSLDYLGGIEYEIKNCVRSTPLKEIVETFRTSLEEALEVLEGIDEEVEYETTND